MGPHMTPWKVYGSQNLKKNCHQILYKEKMLTDKRQNEELKQKMDEKRPKSLLCICIIYIDKNIPLHRLGLDNRLLDLE